MLKSITTFLVVEFVTRTFFKLTNMILILLAVAIMDFLNTVNGQCAITNSTIFLSSTDPIQFADRNNLQLTIEGVTTGSRATYVQWKWDHRYVDKNYIIPSGGWFWNGGGETIVGSGPCESQMYRVALAIHGYLPGSYTYLANNANTPTQVTSPVFVIQDPGPPTNIALRQINNQVLVTWNAPTGSPEATYHVYINTVSVDTVGIQVSTTTYTTNSRATGSSVTVHVRATTGTYLSVPAVSLTLVIRDVQPLNIFTAVNATSATVFYSQASSNNISAEEYTIALTSNHCAGVPTRTEYSTNQVLHLSSLEAGIEYLVTVSANFDNYNLTITGSVTFTTNESAPTGSPGIPSATVIMSTNITITWREIDCLDRNGVIIGYVIQFGEGTTRDRTINTHSNATTHLITGLKPFTQYTLTVAGVNSITTGPESNATSLIRTSQDRPSEVHNIVSSANLYSVLLSWEVPEPLNGILIHYTVQYAINGTRQLPHTTKRTTFSIGQLTPHTLVSDITISATTGGGEGATVMVSNISTLDRPGDASSTILPIRHQAVTTSQCPVDTTPDAAEHFQEIRSASLALNEKYGPPCTCGENWRRIAFLNMEDVSQQCPPNWKLFDTPVRACGKSTAAPACDSAIFSTYGFAYNRICGRILGYQQGSTDAFNLNSLVVKTLESPYMDGVSITYGPVGSRTHIWTFTTGLVQETPNYIPASSCECINTNHNWPFQVPSYVGSNYFCDVGNPGPLTSLAEIYGGNPLWDGIGCVTNNTCCQVSRPPWFCVSTPQVITDSIELRICSDEDIASENVLISLVEIYVAHV